MKKLVFLTIVLVALAFTACNKESLNNDNIIVEQKSLLIDLQVPSDALCGLPLKVQSYWVDGTWVEGVTPFVNTGKVLIGVDANNLYLGIEFGFGFQPIEDNIDIGFYKSVPATMPAPAVLNYHFTTLNNLYYVTLPLNEIMFEGGEIGMVCDEQIYILIHTDTYASLSSDRLPLGAWAGKPWELYFAYTPPCCLTCEDETAWSGGRKYITKGNWATYTPYAGVAKSVILYAGQTMESGMVYFTPSGDRVNIQIELNEGWTLANEIESVKIQGYNIAPVVQPSPGLFKTYKGNQLSINVPLFSFYGVHLDLIHCE